MPQGKTAVKPTREENLWWALFLTFVKIGAFTIGGGYVMLPLIEEAIVRKKKWLESEQFMDMIAISQSVPGVIAINAAVSVGYRIAGLPGAVVATLGASLPSFITIMVIAGFFLNFQQNLYVEAFFKGARPAVTVLLLLAAYDMGKKFVKDKAGMVIIGAGLAGMILFGIHPILAILAAGLFGVVYYR